MSKETNMKKFIQEILKTEGLVVAEQISDLAINIFGEEGRAFCVNDSKREELESLLREINQEVRAAREAYELGIEKATGYESLIKPFKNMFYYMSENIHESRAKNLAIEAAQLFMQESVSKLIQEVISVENVNKLKNIAVEAASKYTGKVQDVDMDGDLKKIVKNVVDEGKASLTGDNTSDHENRSKSTHKDDSKAAHKDESKAANKNDGKAAHKDDSSSKKTKAEEGRGKKDSESSSDKKKLVSA